MPTFLLRWAFQRGFPDVSATQWSMPPPVPRRPLEATFAPTAAGLHREEGHLPTKGLIGPVRYLTLSPSFRSVGPADPVPLFTESRELPVKSVREVKDGLEPQARCQHPSRQGLSRNQQ